jgi:proteasome lid subunit RPN8/RPN11
MPGLNIRIAPPEAPKPDSLARPLELSQRWASPYDGSGLKPNISVFVTRPAYIRICVHACSAEVEVGGALVGQWCQDEQTGQQFIIVKHVLPARFTKQGAVYLTFTQETILDFHNQIDKRFEGDKIVGWFHTHPRMGVFLSHYDTFLHHNFFPEPWQVALVVEPFSSVAGFFIRQADGIFDPTRSIVRWQNLQKVEAESEGGPHNE